MSVGKPTVVSRVSVTPKSGSARWRLCTAAAATLALLTAGCASAVQPESAEAASVTDLKPGPVNVSDAGDPVGGGTAVFGAHAEPGSLDPARTIAAGTTGGIEMLNIYDSLVRFDAESKEFVPQLAQSLEHDDGYRIWTMRLRDNVTFSDGEPVDSAAVKASHERYAGKPAPEASVWNRTVESIDTPDDSTVVYTLTDTWSEFPGLLASGPGMIVSLKSDGPDGQFTPVGAGPFTLQSWATGDHMMLAARNDYWAGAPYLDAVRVVYMSDSRTRSDTLFDGGIDAVLVTLPDELDEILRRGMSGYVSIPAAGNVGLINATEGRPGADPRLRRAMALAVDPEVVMQRAFGFENLGDSAIFPEASAWHTETRGLAPDSEEAGALVAAAKADGYDGKLVVVEAPGTKQQQRALAIQAQLEAVGFDVDVKVMPTVNDQIRTVAKDRDYDLTSWGLNFRDSSPFPKLFEAMHSDGAQLYGMHTSPEMDALIDRFRTAPDRDTRMEVMEQIQQKVNEDVPFLVYSSFADFVAWDSQLHGVVGSSNSMVTFGRAWQSR